jgi:general secretion pathway protein G
MNLMSFTKKIKAKKGKGFTLVELLVVVAILAILVAALLPKFLGYTDNAREAQIKADLSTMKSIVEIYAADVGAGNYPAVDDPAVDDPAVDDIGKVLTDAGINWTGDNKGIVDPYNKAYAYAIVGEAGDASQHFVIASPGKDGDFGTTDDIYVTDNSGQPTKGSLFDIAGESANTPWYEFFSKDEGGPKVPTAGVSYSYDTAPGTDE